MHSKIALAVAFITVLSTAPAWAQLSPPAQRLVDGVPPQKLQEACAKGAPGINALVRDQIQSVPMEQKQSVGAEGPKIGAALAAKCPK